MRRLIFVVAALLSARSAEAASFSIRQSITDKNVLEKPAQISFTDPENGDSSYALDLGIAWSDRVIEVANPEGATTDNQADDLKAIWDLTIGVEAHRNTLTAKEQDSRIATLALSGVLGKHLLDPEDPRALLPQFAAKWKRDGVQGTQSGIASADVTAIRRRWLMNQLSPLAGAGPVGFQWQPRVGLEFAEIFDAETGKDFEGNVLRGVWTLGAEIYPLQQRLRRRLVVWGSFQGWEDLDEDAGVDDGKDSHKLLRYGIRYNIDPEGHFSVGLERLDGENPSEGLADQAFTQIALQVKF